MQTIICQIWAVLTKRQEMSVLMWAHGEESLAKSLVACKLYKAMAHEAAEDDLDTEIYDELKSYAKDFEMKGVKLLDYCYRCDADRAQRLLTCELHSWSNQSCLSLAVAANHRALLAHPCSQVILADLWMGGLRTRKNTNLKVNNPLFIYERAFFSSPLFVNAHPFVVNMLILRMNVNVNVCLLLCWQHIQRYLSLSYKYCILKKNPFQSAGDFGAAFSTVHKTVGL